MLSITELGWEKELLAVCAKDERAADRLQNSQKKPRRANGYAFLGNLIFL